MIKEIKAHVDELESELKSGFKHNAVHRIQHIQNMLNSILAEIEISYVVNYAMSNTYILFDTVHNINCFPLYIELDGYRWPMVISGVDPQNNSVLLKYPLPEIPKVGAKAYAVKAGL